jgi:hypothetical protein
MSARQRMTVNNISQLQLHGSGWSDSVCKNKVNYWNEPCVVKLVQHINSESMPPSAGKQSVRSL